MGFFIGCGIILKQSDGYILVQEVRHEKAGFYNLPAGTLEVGEDLIQCVSRETVEETGAKPELEHFVGAYQTVIADGNNVVFFVFAGNIAADTIFQSDEHTVIKVFTYEELQALDKSGELRSPIVLKSIQDYRAGQKFPLQTVQSWHVDDLASITVEKDH